MSKPFNSICTVIFGTFVLFFLVGCAYQNRTVITNLSEFNGKLYIATKDGNFRVFDIKKNQFKKIDKLEGRKVTNLLRTNKSLIVETSCPICVEKNTRETFEYIYAVGPEGNFEKLFSVRTNGAPKHFSSLLAADDNYIYGISNKRIRTADQKYEYQLYAFRYDIRKRQKIDHHFEDSTNLVVQDIFEDHNYYWYACYKDPEAESWMALKGNVIIARKDKITNELKQISIGSDLFDSALSVTGDKSNIWLFEKSGSKLVKINKNDFSFETVRMYYFLFDRVKERPHAYLEDYLWLFLSKNGKHSLHRINKSSLHDIQVVEIGQRITAQNTPAVSDDSSIWIGLSKYAPQRNMDINRIPYLLKISKDTMQREEIPVDTTLSEGLNNTKNSFIGYFTAIILGLGH